MTPPFLAMVKKDHCFSNIEKGNLAGIEQLGIACGYREGRGSLRVNVQSRLDQ